MLSLFKINKKRFRFVILFVMVMCLFYKTNSFANTTSALVNKAEKHVEEMMIDIQFLLEVGKNDPEKGRTLLSELLIKYFDSNLIAKYSSMPAWRKASDKEREQFVNLFEEYLINLAANRFNEFKNVDYIISKTEQRGKKMLLVEGLIKAPGSKRNNTPVSWRLTLNKDQELKIIDIEIAKISMIVAQNDEFTAIIRQNKGKFSSLIDVLRKELEKN
jgi:phospholipid transport system substrate-binding protein